MSVKELKLVGINKMNCNIQTVEKDGFIDFEFEFSDRNNHGSYLYLDRNQAHLLMLYLQEHLNKRPIDGKDFWLCGCGCYHKKDFVCERIGK
jgi:hypothetical protein